MRPLYRPDPRLPVQAMRTYAVDAPVDTHWRRASCEEAGCLPWRHGWTLDATALSDRDLAAVERSGRRYRREDGTDPGGSVRVLFVFEAGQPCFRAATHRVRVDRPPLFVVRGGDWRAHLGRERVHSSADAWVDDFATNQDRLATAIQKG